MSDRDGRALLRAILERPDDDVSRLVYADWLEESGEPLRAELIRVQCRISQLDMGDGQLPPGAERESLFRRAEELIDVVGYDVVNHPAQWPVSVTMSKDSVGFRRGLVHKWRLRSNPFMKHAAELFSAHPIAEVELTDKMDTWHYRNPDRTGWVLEREPDSIPLLPGANVQLPKALFDLLDGQPEQPGYYLWKHWPDREGEGGAYESLSRACVAYGRSLAGLPPI